MASFPAAWAYRPEMVNGEYSDELQSLGWRYMFRERHCPPLSFLKEGGKIARIHLESCKSCRDDLSIVDQLEEVGKALVEALGNRQRPYNPPVKRGQIRRINPRYLFKEPQMFFDRENRKWFNPPLVVTLDNPDKTGFVTVSQIFTTKYLCAYGDVDLGGDEYYAEAWNTYGLPVKALESRPPIRYVGREITKKILHQSRCEFPKLDRRRPLYYFRSNEIDVGSFFSLPLNFHRISELETEG